MKSISIVIPVYRNTDTLDALYSELKKLQRATQDKFNWELMFVDDGSDDGSRERLLEWSEKDGGVNIISLTRNFGQVQAIIAGLHEVTGDAAIIMASDLQDPVEIIPQLAEAWEDGGEIVIASRKERNDGLLAAVASRIFYSIIRIEFPAMPPGGFDFLLLDAKAVESLNTIHDKNRFLQGDILWLGYKVKFIPYERRKRLSGKSQQKLNWKTKYFIDGILNTIYWPIRLLSLIGVLTFLSGIIYTCIIIYLKLANQTPFTGWAPLMVMILLIGGLNLLTLGLIGEYIWRIYDETKSRPGYVIREKHLQGKNS